jgi:hypothetical protein
VRRELVVQECSGEIDGSGDCEQHDPLAAAPVEQPPAPRGDPPRHQPERLGRREQEQRDDEDSCFLPAEGEDLTERAARVSARRCVRQRLESFAGRKWRWKRNEVRHGDRERANGGEQRIRQPKRRNQQQPAHCVESEDVAVPHQRHVDQTKAQQEESPRAPLARPLLRRTEKR